MLKFKKVSYNDITLFNRLRNNIKKLQDNKKWLKIKQILLKIYET